MIDLVWMLVFMGTVLAYVAGMVSGAAIAASLYSRREYSEYREVEIDGLDWSER